MKDLSKLIKSMSNENLQSLDDMVKNEIYLRGQISIDKNTMTG